MKKAQIYFLEHKKKILALALVLTVAFSSIGSGLLVSFARPDSVGYKVGEDVTANLDEAGILRLSGWGDTYNYSDSDSNRAPFYDRRSEIKSVEIDGAVTSVGDYLFYNCENLSGTLTLPATLVYIGTAAFSGNCAQNAPMLDCIINDFTQASVVRDLQPEALPADTPLSENTGEPTAPDEPAEPDGPTAPDEPTEPDEPTAPDEPAEPAEPAEPDEPAATPPTALVADVSQMSEEAAEPEPQTDDEPQTPDEPAVEAEPSQQPEAAPQPDAAVGDSEPETAVLDITEQTLGTGVFYPGCVGVYKCSDANLSFISAVQAAGYRQLLGYKNVTFLDGFGGTVSAVIPFADFGVILPQFEQTALVRPDESHNTYSFTGWTPQLPETPAAEDAEGEALPESTETPDAETPDAEAQSEEPAPVEICQAGGFYSGAAESFTALWSISPRRLDSKLIDTTVGDLNIAISGPLPENAVVSAELVEVQTAQAVVDGELGEDNGNTVLYALDITVLVDGVKYQPGEYGESVTVSITNIEMETEAPIAVYHVDENAANGEAALEAVEVSSVATDEVSFTAERFSLYIITLDQSKSVTFPEGKYKIEYATAYDPEAPETAVFTELTLPRVNCTDVQTLYFKVTAEESYEILGVDGGGLLTADSSGVYTVSPVGNMSVIIKSIGIEGQVCRDKTLTVETTGMGESLTYQWQHSEDSEIWSAVSSATEQAFSIPTDAQGYYRAAVTDDDDIHTSPAVGPVGNEIVLYLDKSEVTISGVQYSGYVKNAQGEYVPETGAHAATNSYVITQSVPYDGTNTQVATSNGVSVSGNNVTVDITLAGIYSTKKPVGNTTDTGSVSIPGHSENVKHATLRLRDTNRINNLFYYTWEGEQTGGTKHTESTLKITSANGDGSTEGKLFVDAINCKSATGIGGNDRNEAVTGLTIAGGDISVITPQSMLGVAIGSGPNGYAELTISGGRVYAENYGWSAAIGGGYGDSLVGGKAVIMITGGDITAINHGAYHSGGTYIYGTGIGGGSCYGTNGSEGSVTITGGTVTAQSGDGNAIGGGNSQIGNGGPGNVNILGGYVTVNGGIGGGSTKSTDAKKTGGTANVNISGGTVTASSIGAGYSAANGYAESADVDISGGSVDAKIAATPTNGDEEVFLTRAILYHTDTNQRNVDISSAEITGAEYYGTDSLRTDGMGMIYLWLPADSAIRSAEVSAGANTGTHSGKVDVKTIGVLKCNCSAQYYSINVACSSLYTLYTDPEYSTEFFGAITVKSGTVIDSYVQAHTYTDENGIKQYYDLTAYYSNGSGLQAVMQPVLPISTDLTGKYHYQISVNTATEVFFVASKNGENTLVLDLAGADAIISENPNGTLKLVRKGYTLDNYTGGFLLTSNGLTTENTLTLLSGTANVYIDRFIASRSGSIIKAMGGTLNLSYSGFDNKIVSTNASPAIEVVSGARLNLSSGGDAQSSLTMEGGSSSAVIAGGGEVGINKSEGFLRITPRAGQTAIQSGKFEYITASNTGALPYTYKPVSGTLIGYQKNGTTLCAANASQSIAAATTFKACGIGLNLSGGVSSGSQNIENGDYKIVLTNAHTVAVTRDGVSLTPDTDYTWTKANSELEIFGAAAYGNLVVTAGAENQILYTISAYNGDYDGEEHGVSLNVATPQNATVKFADEGGGFTLNSSPTFETVGTHTVRYKIEAANYATVESSANVVISRASNEWIVALTCSSIRYGAEPEPHAEAKWGTTSYEYCRKTDFVELVDNPQDPGTYYVRARVAGTSNYAELVSSPLSFSIESTQVYAVAGRVLDKLGGNTSRTVTTNANGAFTILYSFAYVPNRNTILSLGFAPALPSGTKITLMDLSDGTAPILLYYNVGADGCSLLHSYETFNMGTTSPANYNSFFELNKVCTAQYQFCVEYPEEATETGDVIITLRQGVNEVSNTSVTITRTGSVPTPVGSIQLGAVETAGNTIALPVTVSAIGGGSKILGVSLLDSGGAPVSFPVGAGVSIAGEEPYILRGGFAAFDLGAGVISNSPQTVTVTGMAAGSYKIKADICDVSAADRSYPLGGSRASVVTNALTVAAPSSYGLEVSLDRSSDPGGGGIRVVKSETGATLTFDLDYSISNAPEAVLIVVSSLKKIGNEYSATASPWAVSGNAPIALTNGSAAGRVSGVAVTVPPGTSPGTYRIGFTLGATTIPYNIIVN